MGAQALAQQLAWPLLAEALGVEGARMTPVVALGVEGVQMLRAEVGAPACPRTWVGGAGALALLVLHALRGGRRRCFRDRCQQCPARTQGCARGHQA